MMPVEEMKNFKALQVALKQEIVKSRTRIVPFRFYFDFAFDDAGTKDILVVGKTPPATLKSLKSACGTIKAEGECRLVGQEFRLKTDGGSLNMTRLRKFLKEAKIKFDVAEVASFEGGAGEIQHAQVHAEAKRKLVALSTRFAKARRGGAEGQLVEQTNKLLSGIGKLLGKGANAAQTGKRMEELLEAAARNIFSLERNLHAVGRGEPQPEADARHEDQASVTAAETRALAALGKVTERAEEAGQTALRSILSARHTAMEWQKREMALQAASAEEFHRLEDAFHADERQLEADISAAEAALEQARSAAAEALALSKSDALTNRQKKAEFSRFQKMQKGLREKAKAIETLRTRLRELRKSFSAARKRVAAGDKHGTGRHGAHTGLEQQARRSATGGIGADQAGNEWGDSTEKPEARVSADVMPEDRQDRVNLKIGNRTLEVAFTQGADGKRELVDQRAVLARINTIVSEIESRGAKTSTSSSFLSPELEKEAVDRALTVARQCVWDEIWDKQKNDWVPLDRFFVYVGPPRTVRSKGWGHSVQRNKDDAGNSVPKMKLAQANKILNRFREGKIDQDRMLRALNVTMVASDDGGVVLQPNARVMVDRSGSGFTNTSQYPTQDTPGWSLKGEKVRKSRDGGEGEVAGDPRGT